MGNGIYKLLPTPDYNPEDEVWEYPPDSVVRGKKVLNGKEEILFAVEKV